MPSSKELRDKITSLRNTRKITSAMKLVSSAKIKRSTEAYTRSKDFAKSLQGAVARLLQARESLPIELLRHASSPRHITVVVLSSDKGLCGAFHSSLVRAISQHAQESWPGIPLRYVVMGRKAAEQLARRHPGLELDARPAPPARAPFGWAMTLAQELATLFRSGRTDQVWLASNRFVSMVKQEASIAQILPLPLPTPAEAKTEPVLMEPDAGTVFDAFFMQHLQATLYAALQGHALGEHAARMAAMDNATRNTQDLIQRYTLQMNRARQSAITTELTEIVAGAESLAN